MKLIVFVIGLMLLRIYMEVTGLTGWIVYLIVAVLIFGLIMPPVERI